MEVKADPEAGIDSIKPEHDNTQPGSQDITAFSQGSSPDGPTAGAVLSKAARVAAAVAHARYAKHRHAARVIEWARGHAYKRASQQYQPPAKKPRTNAKLLPVGITIDKEPQPVKEDILWLLNDSLWSIKPVAGRLAQELGIPSYMQQKVEEELVHGLRAAAQWQEVHKLGLQQGEQRLVQLQLYVRRGDLVFRDLMEWDLASATASTHIYTSEVCAHLGLDLEWYLAIESHVSARLKELREDLRSHPAAVDILQPLISYLRPSCQQGAPASVQEPGTCKQECTQPCTQPGKEEPQPPDSQWSGGLPGGGEGTHAAGLGLGSSRVADASGARPSAVACEAGVCAVKDEQMQAAGVSRDGVVKDEGVQVDKPAASLGSRLLGADGQPLPAQSLHALQGPFPRMDMYDPCMDAEAVRVSQRQQRLTQLKAAH